MRVVFEETSSVWCSCETPPAAIDNSKNRHPKQNLKTHATKTGIVLFILEQIVLLVTISNRLPLEVLSIFITLKI